MFLALKEIKKEKLRSGLIIAMIALIGYLIFILTGLALGLAHENTDAINSWHVQRITLNATANTDMRQSTLTKAQIADLTSKEAALNEVSVVAKASGKKQQSAVFIGIRKGEFIYQNLKLTSGRRAQTAHEVVADNAFQQAGYKLGSTVKLGSAEQAYTIVGFTNHAKLNIAPVLYGQFATAQQVRGAVGTVASAVVSKRAGYTNPASGTKTYDTQQVIEKLPGYSAQNLTFGMMIGFLMVISLVIIAVFLYILTMQKLPNYAVLRAQGIPSGVLVRATIGQSLLLVVAGLVIAALFTIGTAAILPAAVPMAFDLPLLTAVGAGLLVMALLGSLIPVRAVLHVDPVSVIGG